MLFKQLGGRGPDKTAVGRVEQNAIFAQQGPRAANGIGLQLSDIFAKD